MSSVELPSEITAAYDLEGTTLISKNADFKMEIGDSKQTDFYPQFKVIRSPKIENEFNFSIRLTQDIADAAVTFDKEKTIWTCPDGTVARFYDYGFGEGGGFEFEVDVPVAPKDNIVPFTVQSKGVVFLPQPTLQNLNPDGSSWEDISGLHCERPANVNESLAVYFAGGQMHNAYKAGKAFHLFRPKVTQDAKGNSYWCDWVLDENNVPIGIRIPVEAQFPLTLDPTLGNNAQGTSTVGLEPTKLAGCGNTAAFTMTEAGDATAILFYQSEQRAMDVTMGIYNSSGGVAGTLRADTAGGDIGADGPAWQSQAITNNLPNGTEVRLAIAHDGGVLTVNNLLCVYDDNTTPDTLDYVDNTYSSGTLPSPFPSHTNLAFLISIYIDYTPSGGGGRTTKNTRSHPLGIAAGVGWRITR